MDRKEDECKLSSAALANAQVWLTAHYPSLAYFFGTLSQAFWEGDHTQLQDLEDRIQKLLREAGHWRTGEEGRPHTPALHTHERCGACGYLYEVHSREECEKKKGDVT